VDQRGPGLLAQVGDESRAQPHRPQQIGVDQSDGLGVVQRTGGIVEGHHPGVVDHHVEGGVLGDQRLRHLLDLRRVGDVEFDGVHAGVGADDLVQQGLASAGDDDLVAQAVEGLGQAAADAGSAAGDEQGVASQLHGVLQKMK
jgi:hypothetical protein